MIEPFVIVDTEYTTWKGALESGWSKPGQHREIVQIAAIKIGPDLVEKESLDILVRPQINPILSELFTELTGITQAQVDGKGIDAVYAMFKLQDFTMDGQIPIVCMNGDEGVMRENARLFGWPMPLTSRWHRLRPFLEDQGIDMQGVSSGDLHALTDTPITGHTHNALHDVRSMGVWIRHAFAKGILTTLEQLPGGIPEKDPRST